ncbi:hypothetical protein ETB97_005113 [Aspergillus alliaceus]|uniref:Uncharacterized protein n=1 Tax=Petromyces alliaceus TaxID=209559 RepID=A0A5N7C8L5_PETAA|nr:uncharacterized protein BDW43DRAFT_92516 [Aspergillus alliaceus]KAB8233036.1 hypothetical protein BDW43DRAFT_92516 [Aspergillus alliaceus]KAE8390178.1 hypothetical protein BDV23DRAFT_87787 [Aspergillus alliaceus]KAF5857923.1 hypothetical protein ETB97_005113 [Aspergillus burnettii]
MPDFLFSLLKKKKSTEMEQALDAQKDSVSELTLIEKAKPTPCHAQKNKTRPNNRHYNPADLCFGSCCRN